MTPEARDMLIAFAIAAGGSLAWFCGHVAAFLGYRAPSTLFM